MSLALYPHFLKKIIFFAIVLCLIFVSGCSTENNGSHSKKEGYTVTDDRGKEIYIPKKPEHIICTYVFADEVLLDLVDHKRIAAMDKWVHDPGLSMAVEQAKDVTNVVDRNVEYMVSLHPDLVILGMSDQKTANLLETMGIPVYVYKQAKGITEIPNQVRSIGRAVHEEEKAEFLISDMNKKLEKVQQDVSKIPQDKRKRGILILRFGPIGGEGTIYHDVLTCAGVIDCYNEVRSSDEYLKTPKGTSMILSKEELLELDPDILIMGNWNQGGAYHDSETQLAEMNEDPAYHSLRALRNGNVVIIPQRNVNCLSHHIADGIETVFHAVYPDAVKEQ